MRALVVSLGLVVFLLLAKNPAMAGESAPAISAALDLIERVIPGQSGHFQCEIISDEKGLDVFEIESGKDRIILRGNSAGSLAVGFNWYLRHVALTNFDWRAAGPLATNTALPRPAAKIRQSCLARERFFFNYCTFGYSLPFMGWDGWQRLIDWLAMNGINRPLMQAGQEAVWYRVWKSYGLNDTQIRTYFCGPAHLPWHRMTNIDKWAGPLPMSYIDGQMELQKQILQRARALSMKPILPSFAGHVPQIFDTVQPNAKIIPIKAGWAGVDAIYSTYFLDPNDPLFADVQLRFLKQQTELYGTDHLYAADPFNEMEPPSWKPSYMSQVAQSIYKGMTQGDPDAIWYQMSWTFSFIKPWLKKSKSSGKPGSSETPFQGMANALPKGKMVFLDYHGEFKELYTQTNEFCDKPFIWNYLANFGGCTYMLAPLDVIAERIAKVIQLKNCRGVGSTLEGMSANPIGYELTFEQPWHDKGAVDYKAWAQDYAKRRAGRADPAVAKAWKVFTEKVLSGRPVDDRDHGSYLAARPAYDPAVNALADKYTEIAVVPARETSLILAYVETLDEMFKAAPESRLSDGYRFDAVNMVRQVLAYHSDNMNSRMLETYRSGNLAAFEADSACMLGIIQDVNTLLGSRHEFLLGSWIKDACAWADDDAAESAYYEANARQIVTTWYQAGGLLTDYAFREWNGLLDTYYLPRWEEFVRRLHSSIISKTPLDYDAFVTWEVSFEDDWFRKSGSHFLRKPEGDAVQLAEFYFKKYRAQLLNTGK